MLRTIAPILLVALDSSCAANPGRAPEDRPPVVRDVSAPSIKAAPEDAAAGAALSDEQTHHVMPALPAEPKASSKPTWLCQVQTDAPEIRKHLRLDQMGPTGSEVRLPQKPGFERFEGKGDLYYAGYICETWSADSDDCNGSVVQVAELAAVSDESTEVIWRSKPQLGGGGTCGDKQLVGTFKDLAIGDYDADGRPDLRLGKSHPPRAIVRLFDGTRYEARLPDSAVTNPEFDRCRPTVDLVYSIQKDKKSKTVPATQIPPNIKAALAAAYFAGAACPEI